MIRNPAIFAAVLTSTFATSAFAQTSPRPLVPTPLPSSSSTVPTGAPTPTSPSPASTSATTTPPPTSASPSPAVPTPPQDASANARVARFHMAGYLRAVAEGNLDLLAQRANVSIAEAQIDVARIFPDPTITTGLYQYDVTQQGNPTASVVALNVPLQIGGQRGARIDVAEASYTAAQEDLQDFMRQLRANAAGAFVDVLHAELVLDRREQSAEDLEKLVNVNEQRYRVGDVGEALLLQSRVEARRSRADVIDAQGGVTATSFSAIALLGKSARGWMSQDLTFDGDLKAVADRSFDVPALVSRALAERPDLRAARQRVAQAEKQIDLAKANRVIDIAVGASWQHNFAVNNSPGPGLPSSDFLGAALTFPIPFSRLYKGELNAAYAQDSQANATEKAAEVQVEAEVRAAVARYQAANARVRLYTGGMLADADKVLEKTLYNYTRGGATLVEVLVAQRTDNDVYLAYYDALSDAAHALIAVEEAVGFWDVNF